MLQAALLYVSKCKLMGGRWCRFNKMTERMEFLHLELSETDKFSESWAMVSSKVIQLEEGKGKVEQEEGGASSSAWGDVFEVASSQEVEQIDAVKMEPIVPAPKRRKRALDTDPYM